MEIVFFRCLVSTIICSVGVARARVDWRGSNRWLLLLRGLFGTAALFSFFLTVQQMPLASAVTIQYLAPIFTTIVAVLLFGERIRSIQWLFYALAFAGVFIIKGFDRSVSIALLIIGIFSAFCAGMAYNFVRSLKEKEHPLVVVLHFQLLGAIIGLIFTLFNWSAPKSYWDWFGLLMTGILTQFGQVFLTFSLQAENASKISILNYTGLIYALLFGALFFNEKYDLSVLTGIFLVVMSVVLSLWFGRAKEILADENNAA